MKEKISAHLAIIPEGPLAFDGKNYLYSEGESYYIDRIAEHFERVTLIAHAFKPGDLYYTAIAHRPFEAPNIDVIELPLKHGIPGKFIQLFQSAKIIWKNLNGADCYYIFMPGYAGAMTALFCRFRKKDYFLYLASDWPEEASLLNPFKGIAGKILLPLFHGLVGWLQNSAVRGAKFTLTAGALLRNKYAGYKTPVIETIPRLNWPAYKLFKRKDTCEHAPVTLLFVGYLLERKGGAYFIETIKILHEQGRAVRGVMIGEGEEEETLKALIEDYGLGDIIEMKGHIPNGAPLIEEYRKADLFICPTFAGEGFPRVLYEAMSQGLPIVCSDVCGISLKLKPDHNVLFVPPQDAQAIAEKIMLLLDKPSLRQILIQNSADFMARLIDGADGGRQIADCFTKYIGNNHAR